MPEARHRLYNDRRAIQRPQLPEDVSGAVLIAGSASDKALLMYQWREREALPSGETRLYWQIADKY